MKARLFGGIHVLLTAALIWGSFLATEALAQESSESPPAAEIVNDEGGAVRITGSVNYTAPYFTIGVAQPLVILEDQAGFVDRNEHFLMPVESQTIGQITSDFFTSPFEYSLALPSNRRVATATSTMTSQKTRVYRYSQLLTGTTLLATHSLRRGISTAEAGRRPTLRRASATRLKRNGRSLAVSFLSTPPTISRGFLPALARTGFSLRKMTRS